MADISSIAGLSSLSEDIFYQYMINNNSTSTMLNALSGSDSEDSGSSNLLGAVTSGLTSGSLSSLNGLGNILGSDESLLETSHGLSNFSSILETYMNARQAESSQMAEKLSGVLVEAAQTEDTSSLTYRTVQEIYQYFLDQTSSSSVAGLVQNRSSTETKTQSIHTSNVAWNEEGEFDFDVVENRLQEELEATLPDALLSL